jgi:hypothetical protein
MKFALLLLVLLASLANACLVFHAIYDRDNHMIKGTIVDNGKQTCTFSGRVDEEHHFANCIPTFASYIQKDLNEHLFPVAKEVHSTNPRNQYYTLSARMYC